MYAYIETGHVAQNLLLEAVALNLAAVPMAAFDSAKMMRLFDLPATSEVTYIIPIGYKF